MAIWLSLKPNGGTELTLVNGDTRTGFHRLSGGDWGQIDNEGIFSGSIDTEGASRVGESVGNRTITLPLIAYDTASTPTAAGLASVRQSLATAVRELNARKGTIRFRPSGLSYGVDFEVEHVKLVGDSWPKLAELGACYQTTMVVTVRPYALMDHMDIEDTFATDTFGTAGKYNNGGADWTADAGALTNFTISSGTATAAANVTTENRYIHTGSQHTYRDARVVAMFQPVEGYTSSFKGGVIIRRTDASNYLEAYVDDNGVNSRLRIDEVLAGVRTNLSSTNLAARLWTATGGPNRYWVVAEVVRGRVSAKVFTNYYPVFDMSSGEYASGTATVTSALATAKGRCGVVCTPQRVGAGIADFSAWPFVYDALTLPAVAPFNMDETVVPGNADATVDVMMRSSSSMAYVIGAVGSWRTRRNMLPSYYDSSSTQWAVSAVAGVIGAATSCTSTNAVTPYRGVDVRAIATPATTDTGASLKINRRFDRGVTYTFGVYLKGNLTTSARVKMGRSGDLGTGTASALSTSTWTLYTVTWTPTTTYEYAYVAIGVNAATATTIYFDEPYVEVASTTVPFSQSSYGSSNLVAYPWAEAPIAIVHANLYTPTETADVGNALADNRFSFTTGVSKTVATIDPSMIVTTGEETRVALWADLYISSATTGFSIVAKMTTPAGGNYYSFEYGTTGKTIAAPSAGNVYRTVFLGTFSVSNNEEFQDYSFVVTPTFGGTAPGIDYLVIAPAEYVFSSQTGIPGASATALPTQGETRIASDLSVRNRYNSRQYNAVPGLLGSGMRVAPGYAPALLLAPSSYVVDRTDSNSSGRTLAYTSGVHLAVQPRVLMAGS